MRNCKLLSNWDNSKKLLFAPLRLSQTEILPEGIPAELDGAGKPLFCWSRDILPGATSEDLIAGCWDWDTGKSLNHVNGFCF